MSKRRFIVEFYRRFQKDKLRALYQTARSFILFPNDNAVSISIIQGSEYEPYLFQFLSDNLIDLTGTDVIDLGANNGIFTVEFAELVGDEGRVFAFEPQRVIFQQLCGNVFANGFDNVWTFNLAVGKESGLSKIEVPNYFDSENPLNLGNTSIHNPTSSFPWEEVQMINLDSLDFQKLSLIKIDVQGYECEIISGALSTINKHRPFIFMEVEDSQLKKFGKTGDDLFSLMESQNYYYRRFQLGIPYQTESGECLDCVFIPKEKMEGQTFIIK